MSASSEYANIGNGTGFIYILNDGSATFNVGLTNSYGLGNATWGLGGMENTPAAKRWLDTVVWPANGRDTAGNRKFRVFVDSSGGAVYNTVSGSEVTELGSVDGLQAPPKTISVPVTVGKVLAFTRSQSKMRVTVDGITTAGAFNEITSIVYSGGKAGDEITFCGVGGVPGKFMQNANIGIDLPSISLTTFGDTLVMAYDGTNWKQVVPSRPSVEYLRSLGQPLPIQPGVFLFTPAGGTQIIRVGQTGTTGGGDVYESDISLQGAGVVLGSDLEFRVNTDNANDGDKGMIWGNKVPITLSGNNVNFTYANPPVTYFSLTDEIALSGKWAVCWEVIDASAKKVSFTLATDFSAQNTDFITSGMVKSLDGAKVTNASITGSTKLIDGTVTLAKLSTSLQAMVQVQGRSRATITIPTAQVLTLNSIPVLAVAAPGANKVVKVESWVAKITYNSVAYATNVTLELIFSGAGSAVASEATFLTRTANGTVNMPIKTNSGISVTQLLANTALYVKVSTGDPTAGNSDIVLYIDYSILDV